jgi:hypothetical protein
MCVSTSTALYIQVLVFIHLFIVFDLDFLSCKFFRMYDVNPSIFMDRHHQFMDNILLNFSIQKIQIKFNSVVYYKVAVFDFHYLSSLVFKF